MRIVLPDAAGEDSYDILPALVDASPKSPVRGPVVVHNVAGVFALRQGSWKYVAPGSARGVKATDVFAKEGSEPQLYNLADDPGETTNVAAADPDRVKAMQDLLTRYINTGRSTPDGRRR